MRPPTLLILTDAIRPDHITEGDTPFLHHLTREHSHARSLRPNFGFCERVEFFTGTWPDVNGYFSAFTLDRPSEFETWDTRLWRLLDWESDWLRAKRRRLMRGWFHRIRKIRQPIYEIPMRLLPRVGLTEDQHDFFTELGQHSVETLFDVMDREGLTWSHDGFISLKRPLLDRDSMRNFVAALDEPRDLYLLYQGTADATGHEHGPHTPALRSTLRDVDARVERAVVTFLETYPDGRFVVHGDHGMVAVEEAFDAGAAVRRVAESLRLRVGRHIEVWLDSTVVRVWIRKKADRSELAQALAEDEDLASRGEILTAERCADLHVPPPGSEYGDVLWLAKPGVLVFPDFFRRSEPARGMHGYETDIPEQQSYAVWHHPEVPRVEVDQIHGVDICALLADLLEIPKPADCVGASPLRGPA